MFDIFYFGAKPNLFPFEKSANSLKEAAELSRTEYFWFVHGENDYTGFNWNFMPKPWENIYTHVWPSQWQPNGFVYFAPKNSKNLSQYKFHSSPQVKRLANLNNWIIPENINKNEFDFSWHPNPLELDYAYHFPTQWQKDGGPIYKGTSGIKYVTVQKIKSNAVDIFYMDFNNPNNLERLSNLKSKWPNIKTTRFVNDYLSTIKRIANNAETEFIWVISSICDYTNFDFTWHPESYQREMIHVFPSDNQKRGDTFFIHVPSFRQQMYDLEVLDWFNVINYCDQQVVPRLKCDKVYYNDDTLVDAIKHHQFSFPYALFLPQTLNLHNTYEQILQVPCLWTEKDRSIESYSSANNICFVPKDTKVLLKEQVYDYPYIKKSSILLKADLPLDIVYISNNEPYADKFYEHLEKVLFENSSKNFLKRVTNINGRMAAYKAAANISSTPWFFAVFAKLEVDQAFDWNWQPDYFQQPKHYIFHAKNILNKLVYGHQAMIAYNKKLVLNTTNVDLDFTLANAHEVVPLVSGVAHYNQDPWTTWRTAFREVIKLKYFSATCPTVENEYRLKKWLTVSEGLYSEYNLLGANDAIEYFESVDGNLEKLKLSFEWSWLSDYCKSKKYNF